MGKHLPALLMTVVWAAMTPVFAESLAISDEQVNTSAFVVEGQVFQGEAKKPLMRTQTVFHGTRAYDHQSPNSNDVAVYDFQKRTFAMFDKKRAVRTDVLFKDVLWAQAQINQFSDKQGGLVGFLANPTFVREWDASKSTITLSSPTLTYVAEGRQSSSDIVERFTEFADWSRRVSNLVTRSPHPAQARIELNKELKKYHLQVSRVTRTGGPKARELGTIRCDRTYRMELSEADRNLIREAEKSLKTFKRLSVSEYLGLDKSSKLAMKK